MADVKGRSNADWPVLQALFADYLRDDAPAARRLFADLQRVLQGFFKARMGASPDADDLAQATLLKIHFARDRYAPAQSLKTWVFTIATRTLIDHWRGGAGEREELQSDDTALEMVADELLDPARKVELHRDLNQALLKLKPTERSIVYLYGVEGLSMAEVGEVLSITEGAAKLRAHRAYQELRKHLVLWAALLLWMDKQWM